MNAKASVSLSRRQILTYRQRVGELVERLEPGSDSMRRAGWAGLQDSVPGAAVLSLHARVRNISPNDWAHPSLVQVWGPRFNAFVVPACDVAVFTLGRLPVDGDGRRRAEDTADRLEQFLDGRQMTYRAVGRGLGVHPNSLRYAASTGCVLLRWEGSGPPVVWTVDPPDVAHDEARAELVRRYLHVFGPASVDSFAKWAGVKPRAAADTFERLGGELVRVDTPVGPGWLLESDVDTAARPEVERLTQARLLPSGDTYFLRWGPDRDLIVPTPEYRDELWTSRVWPGAVLVGQEIIGVWRRTGAEVHITAHQQLTATQRESVEAEAATVPIPIEGPVTTRWR